jgi:hypothetical protein
MPRRPKEKTMMRVLSIGFTIVVLLFAGTAFGELYFWTDENGIRHYSNHAPPDKGVDYGSAAEVEHDADADEARAARDARAAEQLEAERNAEAARTVKRQEKQAQESVEEERKRLEAEQREIEERLYDKRRATRSRTRKKIQEVKEIDIRIEELEKSGGNEKEIADLEAQRRAIVEMFYERSRYWKRGGQADLKQHKEIQEQLDQLEGKE